MTLTRKRLLIEIRDFFLFILIGCIATYFSCNSCRESLHNFMVVAAFSTLLWFFLWKGNSWLGNYISTLISWTKFPVGRMAIGTAISVLYTIVATVGLLSFFEGVFDLSFGSGYYITVYSSVIITIFISLVMHSRAFLLQWREAELDKERLKKESLSAQYESLKNQVNPHFLFNSLNALTNLVYEDQDKAAQFIKQLSRVYRYVLETKDREVVPMAEELQFVNSYIFLEKIRFGHKLIIEESTGVDDIGYVAPLSIQMLIENAIKHNIVSEDEPLTVKLYKEDGYFMVTNNLNRKMKDNYESPGVGLENIRNRYKFLTDKHVLVNQDQYTFSVGVPIILRNNTK